MEDFSTFLPLDAAVSGMFVEETDFWTHSDAVASSAAVAAAAGASGAKNSVLTPSKSQRTENNNVEEYGDDDEEDNFDEGDGDETTAASSKSKKKRTTMKTGDNDTGRENEAEKIKKRRQQIAAASRASRARRKRELDDLRDENKRLREERSQFLGKIGELQMKVENMRERGSTDMRVENELLRAQLEEHKHFVASFKRLCDGAPVSLNAKHQIYKQGSDNAQAHVLGLISQSQHDDWLEAQVPSEADIPYSNFSMFYKFKQEYGTENKARKRLHVRVDVLFPGMDATYVSEFFWNSFSDTQAHEKLYKVKGVEVTQLAEDMPDKDTKTVYYRERREAPLRDKDWVMICNRRRKEMASSTLSLPNAKASSSGRVACVIVALATTQHSSTFDSADRITSMFVQGTVCWNLGSECRLCCVFSFPDDFKIKALDKFEDVVDSQGRMGAKFSEVLCSFREMMGENAELL